MVNNFNLLKLRENNNIFYLFPLKTKSDDRKVYLDATNIILDAIRQDKKNNYSYEYGPNYSIEVVRARSYADYVDNLTTEESLYHFNTKNYSFINFNEQQVKDIGTGNT